MMEKKELLIQIEHPELMPVYGTEDASGADIRANIQTDLVLEPGCIAKVPTGVRMAIPSGFEIQVRPRSGLAAKNGITVLNTPGTVDADYRGEICVILINCSKNSFTITPRMRIAQIVLAPVCRAEFLIQEELTETVRGSSGFGHTGTN